MTTREQIPAPYLAIFKSELLNIASNAAVWNGSETGGDLVGAFTHSGRGIVQLATPPGPNARHEVTHFAQDAEYFAQIMSWLMDRLGLQYLGDWHSHHRLGLDRPSGGDVDRIRSVATKNGYRTMNEIIVTCAGRSGNRKRRGSQHAASEVGVDRRTDVVRRFLADGARSPWRSLAACPDTISIHAFHYYDPVCGAFSRCPIRVLPGVSPFRHLLLQCEVLAFKGQRPHLDDFPFDQIEFDQLEEEEGVLKTSTGSGWLAELVEQFEELDERDRETLEIHERDEHIGVSIALEPRGRVVAAYRRDRLHVPNAVHLLLDDEDEPVDVLRALGPRQRAPRFVDLVRFATQWVARFDKAAFDGSRSQETSSSIEGTELAHREFSAEG